MKEKWNYPRSNCLCSCDFSLRHSLFLFHWKIEFSTTKWLFLMRNRCCSFFCLVKRINTKLIVTKVSTNNRMIVMKERERGRKRKRTNTKRLIMEIRANSTRLIRLASSVSCFLCSFDPVRCSSLVPARIERDDARNCNLLAKQR